MLKLFMSKGKDHKRNYVPDVQYITYKNEKLQYRFQTCTKKSYHKSHIGIDDFFANPWKHFPTFCWPITNEYKSIEELPDLLKNMARLACQICVRFQNNVLMGSGFVQRIRRQSSGMCPCHECDGKIARPFAIVTVTTVVHVFDDSPPRASKKSLHPKWNSRNTTVKLFYDRESDDVGSLPTLHGYRLLETDKEVDIVSDWCAVESVTHDMRLVSQLETYLGSYMDLQAKVYKQVSNFHWRYPIVVIIGHPHGGPKKISIGTFDPKNTEVLKDVRNYQRWCRYNYDILTCQGNSGSPVYIFGQPLCGFGYWFGHPHNHSKGSENMAKGYSSIGVEHLSGNENEVKYSRVLPQKTLKILISVLIAIAACCLYFNTNLVPAIKE